MWKKNANKLSKATIEIVSCEKWNPEIPAGVYASLKDIMTVPIVKFLTGKNPLLVQTEITEAPIEKATDTKGKEIDIVHNVVLYEDYSKEKIEKMKSKKNPEKEAIEEFKKLSLGSINELLLASLAEPPSLLSRLPLMTEENLKDPYWFVEMGIWKAIPKGWEEMNLSPRYFVGRRDVLVNTNVDNKYISPNFLKYDPSFKEKYVTFKTRIAKIEKGFFGLEIEAAGKSSDLLMIDQNEIFYLNQPHQFAKDKNGWLMFEDGVKCNYNSPRVKGKLLEIAFKLAPLIEKIDFLGPVLNTLAIQNECVQIIRNSLNIVSFQREVDKTRIGRTDSVGKLAIKGQGQCHGLSTTMCSFLLPFSNVLGIDIKYRGGCTFGSPNDCISHAERHQ